MVGALSELVSIRVLLVALVAQDWIDFLQMRAAMLVLDAKGTQLLQKSAFLALLHQAIVFAREA